MADIAERQYNTETPWISSNESDNLTSLPELNQKTLLSAIQRRYDEDFIYTDVGDILVAVNPFCVLPIYSKSWSHAFIRPDLTGMAPHIFKTAAKAYNAMVQAKKDQVCVISGESGAGKTESAKLIMKQVMSMCKSSGVGQTLQNKISQLNPVLEAFGNAKTALNDNSSRFGKFIQLIFEPSGRIVGAGLEQYLLEKSRVCIQGDQERNFHIFYYLYSGLDQTTLDKLLLKKPTMHRYLKRHPEVLHECNSSLNKEYFDAVIQSMSAIGFDQEEIQDIYSILAAIILIGDIDFEGADGSDDNAEIKNPEAAGLVAELLQLESLEELCFALTTLRTETRGESVDKRYKCSKAADVRDALAKAMYARLFQWMVARINKYLQPFPSDNHLNIGILDIFGFEDFEWNGFEQFCINLANEQLQCYFNHQIFAMEKAELLKEGLQNLRDIDYKDNKPVLDLFLKKPIGLLSLLDEQCRGLNGSEQAFVQRCKDCFHGHSSFKPDKGSSLEFTIQHYAGQVVYKIRGFLERNKDSLPETLTDSVKYSKVKLVRVLFRRPANPNSNLKKSIMRKSQRSVMRAMSRKSLKVKKTRGVQKSSLTVSACFKQSLKELMERIFAASPHFIRCLKPNYEKVPKLCDEEFMMKQLTYTGMLEAVRVRREGFAYRPYFSDFFTSYRSLAYYFTDSKIKGSEAACTVILKKAGLEGWQLGKSRVFLRYFHEQKLHLMLKDMEDKAVLIQKVFRGWKIRKYTDPLREKQKKEKIMVASFLSLMNAHGKEYVDQLISLSKTDILLSKKRFSGITKKRKFTPLSDQTSFKALSDEEKKVRKAKLFGVRLIPSATSVEKEDPVHESEEENSEEESEDEEIDSPASPIIEHILLSSRNSQTQERQFNVETQVPVPRPRLKTNRVSFSKAETDDKFSDNPPEPILQIKTETPTPVPRPRSKSNGVAFDTTETEGESNSSTHKPPESTSQLKMEAPTPLLPPPQLKVIPVEPSNSSQPSSSEEQDKKSTKRWKLIPTGLKQSCSAVTSVAIPALMMSGVKNAWSSQDSKNTSYRETPVDHDTWPKRIKKTTNGAPPSMIQNIFNLKALANPNVSTLSIPGGNGRSHSWSFTYSRSVSSNPYLFPSGPPQADKRPQKKRWLLRVLGGSRETSPVNSSTVPLQPYNSPPDEMGEDESDVNVLGFYPNFNQDKALDYVLGQPRGTYVIYRPREDLEREILTLILMVSLGRPGVKTYPVICTENHNNLEFRLGDVDGMQQQIVTCSHLKDLVDYYREFEIANDLKLTQPRLLAGVFVKPIKGHILYSKRARQNTQRTLNKFLFRERNKSEVLV